MLERRGFATTPSIQGLGLELIDHQPLAERESTRLVSNDVVYSIASWSLYTSLKIFAALKTSVTWLCAISSSSAQEWRHMAWNHVDTRVM